MYIFHRFLYLGASAHDPELYHTAVVMFLDVTQSRLNLLVLGSSLIYNNLSNSWVQLVSKKLVQLLYLHNGRAKLINKSSTETRERHINPLSRRYALCEHLDRVSQIPVSVTRYSRGRR